MRKKTISVALALALAAPLLAGCSGAPAVIQPSGGEDTPGGGSSASAGPPSGSAVKTGFSVMTSLSSSKDASAQGDGTAQTDIVLVGVTVDEDGMIESCVIDGIQVKIGFNAAGQLTTDPATAFASKNELGDRYGMKQASSIGREWYEQAAAMADYAVGKTVDEIKGIAVNEKGVPTQADLASSVTVYIGDFVAGIEDAVNNARHLGAKSGDRLALASATTMAKSKGASAQEEGLAQADAAAAAVTFNGDTVTSCYIDAVQADVNFNAQGVITSDLSARPLTKNQLGDRYGMKQASSIGKEWYEQVAAFSAYVTGKTVDEITSIAVDERTSPTQADLAATVTISIGDFQALLEKAAG